MAPVAAADARASPMRPQLAPIPKEWQSFGEQNGLTRNDVRSLLAHAPWSLTADHVRGIAAHLHKSLARGDWVSCEVCLGVLLRNDLTGVFDTVCQCGLGWLAVVAAEQDASARGPVGSTARLGRVLAAHLDGLLEASVLAQSYAEK